MIPGHPPPSDNQRFFIILLTQAAIGETMAVLGVTRRYLPI